MPAAVAEANLNANVASANANSGVTANRVTVSVPADSAIGRLVNPNKNNAATAETTDVDSQPTRTSVSDSNRASSARALAVATVSSDGGPFSKRASTRATDILKALPGKWLNLNYESPDFMISNNRNRIRKSDHYSNVILCYLCVS